MCATPAPSAPRRRSRAVLGLALLVMGGIACIAWLLSGRRGEANPVGYLIPKDNPTPLRVGWRTRDLTLPYTVSEKETLALPAGSQVWAVSLNGEIELIEGPRDIEMKKPDDTVRTPAEFLHDPSSVVIPQLLEKAAATDVPGITITSPVGLTRFTDPTLDWVAREGVLYDVAIVDPADEAAPPRLLRGVRPPLKTSALETTQRPELPTDRIFGVLVREVGNPTTLGANRFLTARDATADALPTRPDELVKEAIDALSHSPLRTGDAWTALAQLPAGWRNSDLVLRLRAKLAQELHVKAEIDALSRRTADE